MIKLKENKFLLTIILLSAMGIVLFFSKKKNYFFPWV